MINVLDKSRPLLYVLKVNTSLKVTASGIQLSEFEPIPFQRLCDLEHVVNPLKASAYSFSEQGYLQCPSLKVADMKSHPCHVGGCCHVSKAGNACSWASWIKCLTLQKLPSWSEFWTPPKKKTCLSLLHQTLGVFICLLLFLPSSALITNLIFLLP